MLTAKKPRAEKYDMKLAVNDTFSEVMKVFATHMPAGSKVQPKKDKPKKK